MPKGPDAFEYSPDDGLRDEGLSKDKLQDEGFSDDGLTDDGLIEDGLIPRPGIDGGVIGGMLKGNPCIPFV